MKRGDAGGGSLTAWSCSAFEDVVEYDVWKITRLVGSRARRGRWDETFVLTLRVARHNAQTTTAKLGCMLCAHFIHTGRIDRGQMEKWIFYLIVVICDCMNKIMAM